MLIFWKVKLQLYFELFLDIPFDIPLLGNLSGVGRSAKSDSLDLLYQHAADALFPHGDDI